jgi:hypothetical protein
MSKWTSQLRYRSIPSGDSLSAAVLLASVVEGIIDLPPEPVNFKPTRHYFFLRELLK